MEFGLLGPLQVHDGKSSLNVSAPQQRVLLAALLFKAGRVVSAAELTDAIWDDRPPSRVQGAIHTAVQRLRSTLGPAGRRLVIARPPGYLIDIGDGKLDVREFAMFTAQGRADAAAGRWEQATEAFAAALRLWRGEPLADVPSSLLRTREGPPLSEQHLGTLAARIDADLHLGHHSELVAELRHLVSTHPLREGFHAQLMLALYRDGRQADALAAYQHARRILDDELGVTPGPGLERLHQRILQGDPELPGTGSADGKSLAAKTTRRQVVPGQLPGAVRHFTGRDRELAVLTTLAKESAASTGPVIISAIGGTAGIGKTALAVHFAHQVAGQFPDGQLYVNLRGFDPSGTPMTPAQAIRGFLSALAMDPERIPPDLDQQAALYRSLLAGKRILVLLDNARDADQVRALLPGSPTCLVIVTSRNSLTSLIAAEGAHPLILDLLPADEARELLTRRLGASRVANDRQAADELIRLCARLPLALSIAVARTATRPAFPLAAAVTGLRDSGGLGAFDAGDPTTNLRAVFSWSYASISARSAWMFRLLGLHPGPDISVPAAASLAGTSLDEARRALGELTAAHLVAEHAPGRFAFHDLLRAYAAEQTRSADTDAERRMATHRMLDHYLHTANAAAVALTPTRDPINLAAPEPGVWPEHMATGAHALAWFEAEHQVLTAVFGRAGEAGFDAHIWQLAWALARFLDRRGYWDEWAAVSQRGTAAARRLGDVAGQAQSHRYAGRALLKLQRYDEASMHYLRAFDMFSQLGDIVGQGRSLIDVGQCFDSQERFREALGPITRALRLFHTAGHQVGLARALTGLGWCHSQLGDNHQALHYLRQALALTRELSDLAGEAVVMQCFGSAYHHLSRHAEAAICYHRSIEIYRELGDLCNQAEVLSEFGNARYAANDRRGAREAWQQALAIFDDLHHPDADRVRARLGEDDRVTEVS